VRREACNILKQKRLWSMVLDDPHDVVKERALRGMVKAFASANGTEGLARESGREHVKGGNCRRGDFRDIAVRGMAKVCCVSLLREGIPLRAENALATRGLEAQAYSSDPSEQVDESKTRILHLRHVFPSCVTKTQHTPCLQSAKEHEPLMAKLQAWMDTRGWIAAQTDREGAKA
jgi:hypothetical protein